MAESSHRLKRDDPDACFPDQRARHRPRQADLMASARRQRQARNDQNRPRVPAKEAADADGKCLAGGLTVVMNMPLNQATKHFSLCVPCQQQFIRRSGLTAMEPQAPEETAHEN